MCGKTWNVSAGVRLYAGVYVCPECDSRSRRRPLGGSDKRRPGKRPEGGAR